MPKERLFLFYTHTVWGLGGAVPFPLSHPLFLLFFWVHRESCNQETLYSFLFCFQLRTESGLDSTGPDQEENPVSLISSSSAPTGRNGKKWSVV